MGGWTGSRLRIVVGLVLVGGAVAAVGWAYQLPPAERGVALLLPGFVLALIGVLVGAVPLWVRLGRRPATRSVDALATRLAHAVDVEWRAIAHERRLLPDPIPIRWSLSDLAVAGPVAAAVGAPQERPAFAPLPGQARITEADLRAGGGQERRGDPAAARRPDPPRRTQRPATVPGAGTGAVHRPRLGPRHHCSTPPAIPTPSPSSSTCWPGCCPPPTPPGRADRHPATLRPRPARR